MATEDNKHTHHNDDSSAENKDGHRKHTNGDPAVELIRKKVESLFGEEPSAKDEARGVVHTIRKERSKHQEFVYQLTTSGKSLAQIQTAWHNYYIDLPEEEKQAVWSEFYSLHNKNSGGAGDTDEKPELESESLSHNSQQYKKSQAKTIAQLKRQVVKKVDGRAKLKSKEHFQSLLFGLGMGSIAVLILLFSFFNERIIAPFITPSRKVSSTPIIIDQSSVAVDPSPKIIIPKINLEIPVDYTQTSIDEAAVQRSLETGILHYPTTPTPGEKGNAALFGHSSNNIFNKGKYKFAFVLLNKLENGDIFYITKDGRRYAYKVYEKLIVKPTDVYVLGPKEKTATASLITCDPPGTSINRLVVVGEQISPDPNTNSDSDISSSPSQPKQLPSNAPSLWKKIKTWLFS